MRSAVREQASREAGENAALREQAEREAAKAESALARIEGDYVDGKIDAEAWARLEARLRAELEGARAQMEQHDRQRQAIEAQIATVDAEAIVLGQLAALRRAVTAAINDATGAELDQLRALLRRLFVGFELASPGSPFGSPVPLPGARWVRSGDAGPSLAFDGGYYLLPVLRDDAVDLDRDDPAGFPSVARIALHDNLCSFFAAW
jgi:hypothetical protein